MEKSVFETLNNVNVSEHIEKKNGLSYVAWAWAWQAVKKLYPLAQYKIYENEQGWNYFTDGRTCWVKTGVEIGGLEHIEYLPVMDYNNKSIPLEKVSSFDVNKTIQRSLTKALARHGLGLYVYAGEDLPEGEEQKLSEELIKKAKDNGVSIPKLAIYLNKKENELTDADVEQAIKLIQDRRNKQWLVLMNKHTHTQTKPAKN